MKVKNEADFTRIVWDFYSKHARKLPWRGKCVDAYKVFVSEIMLQQTQVDRVMPKYRAFLQRFPTVEKLATATNKEVLGMWQGLGYNRRALFMKQAAKKIVEKYNRVFPKDPEVLESLPGIGPYTARAIAVFAYNQTEVFIETNIRSVYIHHFFPRARKKVDDTKLVPIIARTVDQENPREWYAALMDYGSHLKKTLPNPSRKSKQHAKQSRFKGSQRELRGKIIKELVGGSCTGNKLETLCKDDRLYIVLDKMISEGVVQKKGKYYVL